MNFISKNITLTVFSVTAITLVARVLTLISIQLYMSFYGAKDPYLNIYSYALTMPNTIFTCIGTLLTTVVVPIYSSLLAKKQNNEAKKFLDDVISISSILILALILIGIIFAPVLVKLSKLELYDYAVFSIRVLMPVMLTYGLTFIFQGILQSHGKFKLSAAVSIPTSLITMGYVLIFGEKFGVTGLLFATFLGLSMQAVILLPSVIKTGYRFKPSFDFKNEHIIKCTKLILPVLLGVSAYQINTIFNATLATKFNSVTLMQNVQNLVVISILTFVYSLTSVYYPKFTTLWASKNINEYKKTLGNVSSLLIFLLLPATFGFISIRYEIFNLLTNWGKVTQSDVILSGQLLGLYSLGICALGFKEVLDRAFYSQGNAKISGLVGVLIMSLNVVFSLTLINMLGILAMPISFSLSSTFGVLVLLFIMNKKAEGFLKQLFPVFVKCLLAAVVMFLVLYFEVLFLGNVLQNGFVFRAIKLFVPILSGVVIYFLITYLLKANFLLKNKF